MLRTSTRDGLPGTGFGSGGMAVALGPLLGADFAEPWREEQSWPKGTEEKFEDWKVRLKQTALALPENAIRKAMQSMRRRCLELRDNGGEWIKND